MTSVLQKVYEYMDRVTPLTTDCGKICDRKCCKGADNDGMLLFPGENELFLNNENFSVYFDERYNCFAVRCNGSCDRSQRPLSCRIFPYLIYLKDEASHPVTEIDLRAVDFCPLISEKYSFNRKFLRALRISAKKLCEDPEMREYLIKITGILTDFNSL